MLIVPLVLRGRTSRLTRPRSSRNSASKEPVERTEAARSLESLKREALPALEKAMKVPRRRSARACLGRLGCDRAQADDAAVAGTARPPGSAPWPTFSETCNNRRASRYKSTSPPERSSGALRAGPDLILDGPRAAWAAGIFHQNQGKGKFPTLYAQG